MALNKQMEMFEDGGLKDEGGMTDEVSGNDVPSGSTREEVRDDIPAQLSEGEFVFPADVVRFIGLEKLMMLRQEAKQGLKQMEAMGQMGNSDEATMRDDMPFDINDLDMEDEVEYNRGGVVEAANGTFVQNAMPITYNPLNTTQTSTATGNPTQMQPTAVTSNPYTGNPETAYKTGIQPYAPVDYATALGTSATGAPQTESVRYFNAATGQSRMIPHIINADGSRGTTLFPVPDGFVVQEEAPKEEAKKTTKVQSAKVASVDSDDSGKGFDGSSTKDQSFIDFNKSTLASTSLKGLMSQTGILSGLAQFSPSYNIGRGIAGKGNVTAAKGAAIGGILDAFRGGKVEFTTKGMKTNYANNKSLNDMSVSDQNKIGRVGSAIFSTIVDPSIYNTDEKGNKTSKSDIEIRNSFLDRAKDLGLKDVVKGTYKGTNVKIRTLTIIRAVLKEETKKAEETIQQGVIDRTDTAGKTTDRTTGPVTFIDDEIMTRIQEEQQSKSDDGTTGNTDLGYSVSDSDFSGFSYNKGGLAGKKKTPKPKKMKRGGLASR